jgi:hypothetical protein
MPKPAGDAARLTRPGTSRLVNFAHSPQINELVRLPNSEAQRRGRSLGPSLACRTPSGVALDFAKLSRRQSFPPPSKQDGTFLFLILVKIDQRQKPECADICRRRVRHSGCAWFSRPAPAGIQPPRWGRSFDVALMASFRPIIQFAGEHGEFRRNGPGAVLGGRSAPEPFVENVAVTASDVRPQADHIPPGGAVLFCSLPDLRDQYQATESAPKVLELV